MKIKVIETSLKTLINEATYQDAFNQIKDGDTLIIKTGKDVYKTPVVDKLNNQVTIKWGNIYYVITNTSYDGKNLETIRLVKDKNNKPTTKINGPTIKGVYSFIVKRGDKIITSVTPQTGRSTELEKNQKKSKAEFETRRSEIFSVFDKLTEGDIVEITTGKLITKGLDKGSLAKNTITTINFICQGLHGNWIKLKLKDSNGFESDKYSVYKNSLFFISSGSIKIVDEGIILVPKVKDLKTGKLTKLYIKNVFGVDKVGRVEQPKNYELTTQDKMDIIRNSPALRKRYLNNPSFLDKLFNRNKTDNSGDATNLLNIFNSNKINFKINDKIPFIYYGDDIIINSAKDLRFEKSELYLGKYIGDNKIMVKSSNRKDTIIFTLIDNPDKNGFYNTKIEHQFTNLNKLAKRQLDSAKIKIKK